VVKFLLSIGTMVPGVSTSSTHLNLNAYSLRRTTVLCDPGITMDPGSHVNICQQYAYTLNLKLAEDCASRLPPLA
jgi:hypothetical protein